MKVSIVKSVKDDFHEMSGPSQVTHAFLSTGWRLAKVREFEKICAECDFYEALRKLED